MKSPRLIIATVAGGEVTVTTSMGPDGSMCVRLSAEDALLLGAELSAAALDARKAQDMVRLPRAAESRR